MERQTATPDDSSPKSRANKRQKVTRACDTCKSRKRRCTGELPCSLCWNNGSECTYNAAYTRGRLVEPAPSQHTGSQSVTKSGHGSSAAYRDASPDVEPTTFAGQYLGPASPYAFLRRAWKRFGGGHHSGPEAQTTLETGQTASVFSFGDRLVPHVTVQDFRLPDRATTKKLLDRYFDQTMPTYRFLHRQTTAQWLEEYHIFEEDVLGDGPMIPARQALVLTVLAAACLFDMDELQSDPETTERLWQESERYHQVARRILADERGRVLIVSVQARLATCLYLLQTSRPNQAWYTFGNTVQMVFSLGMHRAGAGSTFQQDPVKHECRKRAFWTASTLDTYLSVILGRPALIQEDDCDQLYPASLDDEEVISKDTDPTKIPKDKMSVITASILHARLARIVKKAAREQYAVARRTNQRIIDTATKLNAEIAAWHDSLPVVLSGAVHPSSLMPVYRRQITILQLAHAHAIMITNRPLLLQNTTSATSGSAMQSDIDTCISAAKSTLDMVNNNAIVGYKSAFPALWMTQYVTFLALSIVYVWLIQRRHGRLAAIEVQYSDEELMALAETVQTYLAEATQTNAPSLRYSIVLEELHQETRRLLQKTTSVTAGDPGDAGGVDGTIKSPLLAQMPLDSGALPVNTTMAESIDWANWGSDFPLDPDLWLQLDSFPFTDGGIDMPD